MRRRHQPNNINHRDETMSLFPISLLEKMEQNPIVAGFSIHDIDDAVPITEALLEGGIRVIELTLRTPSSIHGLKRITESFPEVIAGVGTILQKQQVEQAVEAGADFGVAPGLNAAIVKTATEHGLPFAPGIVSPSDLELAIELGCGFVKFFPAEASGGTPYLKSLATPYRHLGIKYFPLGGINQDNMNKYLSCDDVLTIGGSWIVKQELVERKQWHEITARAKAASQKALLKASSFINTGV